MFNRIRLVAFVGCISALLSGCVFMNTYTLTKYEVTPENISIISGSINHKVGVEQFNSEPEALAEAPIKMRGHSFYSPYALSYSRYIQEALTFELQLAEKYNSKSKTVITGTLLKNDLDTSKGYGVVEVKFIVKRSGRTLYEKTHSAETSWQPAFTGVEALTQASKEYSPLVSQLLNKLYTDKDFISCFRGH